jgi:hypothetical protein
MTRRIAPSIADTPPRAHTVGQDRETPSGQRKQSSKDYADVIVALVCLAAMAGTIYFAELDSNYTNAMHITAAIRRALHR